MLYTVRGLEDRARGVMVRVRVLSKEQPRSVKTRDGKDHKVVDTRVGDRTGTIIMPLWDDLTEQVDVGDVIDVMNGYVNRFKGRLRLNVGRFGELRKVEDPTFPTAEEILRRFKIRRGRWRSIGP